VCRQKGPQIPFFDPNDTTNSVHDQSAVRDPSANSPSRDIEAVGDLIHCVEFRGSTACMANLAQVPRSVFVKSFGFRRVSHHLSAQLDSRYIFEVLITSPPMSTCMSAHRTSRRTHCDEDLLPSTRHGPTPLTDGDRFGIL
jgi:hypothetical protein